MKFILSIILLIGIFATRKAESAGIWGYTESNGPQTWAKNFPQCGESAQSPIAIYAKEAVVNDSLIPFPRSLFDSRTSAMLIKNNKHALQVDLMDGYVINNLNLLPGAFKAAQFHIHWGNTEEYGSEHTLNGIKYFGELHVVHYNTKYPSIGAAASKEDGLAVLGVFLKDDYPQDNLAFERFLGPVTRGAIKYYPNNLTFASEDQFSIETLLPHDLTHYYRYHGSLTAPPCYESVLWTVFDTPLRISRAQATVLKTNLFVNKNRTAPEVQLYGNHRPVQPLNGRMVTKSPSCPNGSTPTFQLTLQCTSMIAMLATTLFLLS